MAGLLFVTAPSADYKVVNRFLLHLRDIEFSSDDRFHLASTKNAYDLDKSVSETVPPVPSDFFNAWKGATLDDVEAFTLDLNKNSENAGVNSSLFVLLDEEGLQDKTCILAQRHINWEEESDDLYEDKFDKVRLPWAEAYIMWCNLDIANMDFQDFCHEEEIPEDGSFWTYKPIHTDEEENVAAIRDEQVRKMESEGMA